MKAILDIKQSSVLWKAELHFLMYPERVLTLKTSYLQIHSQEDPVLLRKWKKKCALAEGGWTCFANGVQALC